MAITVSAMPAPIPASAPGERELELEGVLELSIDDTGPDVAKIGLSVAET